MGVGSFHPAWWTGDPGISAVEVRVDPSRWRQGIGTRLYELLRSRLMTREATRLVSWVRADAANARRFAELLSGSPAVRPSDPQTNIVMVDLRRSGDTPESVSQCLAEAGVRLAPWGPRRDT